MERNASLGDYLFALRRTAPPGRLGVAIGAGVFLAAGGLFLGPRFIFLIGIGLAIAGVCAWARLGQLADAMLDGTFDAPEPRSARRFRVGAAAALALGAIGILLFFYSFAIRFLRGATGL